MTLTRRYISHFSYPSLPALMSPRVNADWKPWQKSEKGTKSIKTSFFFEDNFKEVACITGHASVNAIHRQNDAADACSGNVVKIQLCIVLSNIQDNLYHHSYQSIVSGIQREIHVKTAFKQDPSGGWCISEWHQPV